MMEQYPSVDETTSVLPSEDLKLPRDIYISHIFNNYFLSNGFNLSTIFIIRNSMEVLTMRDHSIRCNGFSKCGQMVQLVVYHIALLYSV